MAHAALELVHETDPRDELLRELLPRVAEWHILRPVVLVAVYEPPADAKTKGGLIIPEKTRSEYAYQGKTGLVIKIGELAFTEDPTHRWTERKPVVGEWLQFFVGDTRAFMIGKWTCRYLEDVDAFTIVPEAVSAY